MEKQEFTKETMWDQSHKLCKVRKRQDKNGKDYMIGDYNHSNTITIKKTTGDWAKEDEFDVCIIPIKYRKVNPDAQQNVEALRETHHNNGEVPNDQIPTEITEEPPIDSVPF